MRGVWNAKMLGETTSGCGLICGAGRQIIWAPRSASFGFETMVWSGEMSSVAGGFGLWLFPRRDVRQLAAEAVPHQFVLVRADHGIVERPGLTGHGGARAEMNQAQNNSVCENRDDDRQGPGTGAGQRRGSGGAEHHPDIPVGAVPWPLSGASFRMREASRSLGARRAR